MNLQDRAAAAVVALFASEALAAAQPTTIGPVDFAQTLVLSFRGVALGVNDYGDVVGHSDYRAGTCRRSKVGSYARLRLPPPI